MHPTCSYIFQLACAQSNNVKDTQSAIID
jgi:hypothetical protein